MKRKIERIPAISIRAGAPMFSENDNLEAKPNECGANTVISAHLTEDAKIEEHKKMIRCGFRYVGGATGFDKYVKRPF